MLPKAARLNAFVPPQGIWAHRSTQTQAELGQNRQIYPRPSERTVFKRRLLYINILFEIKEPFLKFNPRNSWILRTLNHWPGSKKAALFRHRSSVFLNESKLSRKTEEKHKQRCVKAEVKTLYSHLLKGIVRARVKSHTHKNGSDTQRNLFFKCGLLWGSYMIAKNKNKEKLPQHKMEIIKLKICPFG